MSAKKGKNKENEEELALQKVAALKKLKADYPVQCKKFITEPLSAVVKKIDKGLQSTEEIDKIIISSYSLIPSDIWALYATFDSYLALNSICLWSSLLDSRGLDALAKFATGHQSISTLHLIDCKIMPQMTIHLSHILKDSKTLTTIVLDHNGLGSTGAVNVFVGLRNNPINPGPLKSLSLRYCDIGSKAAETIASTLAMNNSLTFLDLTGNCIGDDGLFPIAKALATNATLKTLNLSANNIQNRELGFNPYHAPPSLAAQQQQAAARPSTSPLTPSAQTPAVSSQTSITVLCAVLATVNTGLSVLDLSGNHIGVAGGECILEMLKTRKPLAAGKKCESLQVDVTERMGEELYGDVMDMNDVMEDIAKKNTKAGGGKGKKK
ncbi:NACHT, LRR and PYD domains-containing protein 4 [Entophlyctis luteolus]|nr:NACHT, LRR and PYD domains-containing protein 4 [Entophlyctis luteolus]KAJ3355226.1 NACHT, LRR and PYD domains-containing protein 4 [Entophlyctis luteolus]KAJ3391861.1 NACHT, LRR and PYD domains-containing protein 4 [Entophlyctis sp. JEL0112]